MSDTPMSDGVNIDLSARVGERPTIDVRTRPRPNVDVGYGIPGSQGPQGPQGPQGEGGPGAQGPAGPQGEPGQGFTWQGQWTIGQTYHVGDVVRSATGTIYVAVADHGPSSGANAPGVGPEWQVMTTAGSQGPQGAPGRGLEAIIGTLPDVADLPPTGEIGDAYIVNPPGDLWVRKPI